MPLGSVTPIKLRLLFTLPVILPLYKNRLFATPPTVFTSYGAYLNSEFTLEIDKVYLDSSNFVLSSNSAVYTGNRIEIPYDIYLGGVKILSNSTDARYSNNIVIPVPVYGYPLNPNNITADVNDVGFIVNVLLTVPLKLPLNVRLTVAELLAFMLLLYA